MFKIGQKCLCLFEGRWRPCQIMNRPIVHNTYWVMNDGGAEFTFHESHLKPANLLDKPREFSETVPAPMSYRQIIAAVIFQPRLFMNAGDQGMNRGS